MKKLVMFLAFTLTLLVGTPGVYVYPEPKGASQTLFVSGGVSCIFG